MENLANQIVDLMEDYDPYSFDDAYLFDDAAENIDEQINQQNEDLLDYVTEMYEFYKETYCDDETLYRVQNVYDALTKIYKGE